MGTDLEGVILIQSICTKRWESIMRRTKPLLFIPVVTVLTLQQTNLSAPNRLLLHYLPQR